MIPQTDHEFLKFNEVYFEQARLGFLHGMPPATLAHMEHLYRTHLDKNFILTAWCSSCVVDMMVRLSRWWEGVQQEEETTALASSAAMDRIRDQIDEMAEVINSDPASYTPGNIHTDKQAYTPPKSRRKRVKLDA